MIAMAKAVYYPKGERQKTIIKLLNSLEGRYSRWDIWQDFIVLSAVSIANAFGGPYREQREAMYLERSKKYSTSELEVLAQMLAEVVDEMEQNPDQDKARHFVIETPLGKLEVYAKHDKSDCAEDYPGVFIDFVREDGATVVLACVEYDPDKDLLQTVVYGDCASDEPTAIVEHYNTDFEE